MPTPVLESIAETIVTRIKAGTYTENYQIQKVTRPNKLQTNKSLEHLHCLVMQGNPERGELDHDGNPIAYAFNVPYLVYVHLRPSDTETTPLDTIVNYVTADVLKAITTPNATWHNFDSKAVNADYDFEHVVADDGSEAAVLITLRVETRFSQVDPYTFRA